MQELKDLLEKRIYHLKEIIRKEEKSLKKMPEGSVQITGTGKKTMFYFNNDGNRTYANQKDQKLVRQLCQKDYNQKILAKAKPVRQELISPIWLPDNEFVKQWEDVSYIPKGFDPDYPEYYTDKGERVRSKSEILIANALQKYHIPYRYEYPYQFESYGPLLHPDFTVLNIRTRKELIWEHMGKMDDEDYSDYALNRILNYEKYGIFPGDKLILTHETLANPLNSKIIEKTIKHYLK